MPKNTDFEKTNIESLNKLSADDIYSVLLFVLFQLRKDNNYSVLSELMMLLGRDEFVKLCFLFGGSTITIPTLQEIRYLLRSLLIYYELNSNNVEITEEGIEKFYQGSVVPGKEVIENVKAIQDVMKNYAIHS